MKSETTAVVFPGQGTQKRGMGEDFFNTIPASRAVYEEASQALGWDVAGMCFQEDARLDLTEYAQPCLLASEIAMLYGLREAYGFNADYFGGHSLGEYTALVAAGAMPLTEALRLVSSRGRLMQQASPEGVGRMVAVIGEDIDLPLMRQAIAHLEVDVANINSRDQVVLSGRADSMKAAEDCIRQALGRSASLRFVPLNVSAPFHSRFMADIENTFEAELAAVEEKIEPARAGTVTSNYTGDFYPKSRQAVIGNLVRQISGTVQWRRNMSRLSEQAETIYEIGPGRPLRAFFGSMKVACRSITTLAAAEKTLADGPAGERQQRCCTKYTHETTID